MFKVRVLNITFIYTTPNQAAGSRDKNIYKNECIIWCSYLRLKRENKANITSSSNI